ncbi:MAG: putative phage abortive infection protein [Chryseobacterium sp.]|uniref:putative phage abortive infection protein n=1 Tax=Chryseobacterium sp. TaxID=1871047 RepID=UPI001B1653A7|nr:putative phage abortive infection protein [Chryseobacterium sp.]MBO6184156.1 putative phage abortive infection protein [Chryseobacterium sp.]
MISLVAVLIVTGMWLLTYFLLRGRGIEVRGTFGDMFGSVNAIYSGLAFAGIIITIYLQSHELKLQRKELRDTRREFEIQNATLSKQQFENTFFQMISLFTNIVENSKYITPHFNVQGRDVFDKLLQKYNGIADDHIKNLNNAIGAVAIHNNPSKKKSRINIDKNDAVKFYDMLYFHHKNILAHYFRTLYHIVKLINTTQDIDKKFYISIIRSQLSSSEQILLFYNCLHTNGNLFFKPLVEEHVLLKNIDINMVINRKLKEEFADTAFKRALPTK